MHQNQQGIYTNSLSGHANLLLSASPTIITSPLHNNTNNPQSSQSPTSSLAHVRRQPSTPLLAASNLDNDSHANTESSLNNLLADEYINFKKPQNEIFKKLDGKIQKIVAAHSNLNKLYALNDFPGIGVGPKRPLELPPQLPPPPPWVPKVGSDSHSLSDESTSPSGRRLNRTRLELSTEHDSSMYNPGNLIIQSRRYESGVNMPASKSSSLTLDSAISKIHQRRQQQQQQSLQRQQGQSPPKISISPAQAHKTPIASSSSANTNQRGPNTSTISPVRFALLAQKIKETLESQPARNQGGSLSMEEKKKFQENLIALLKREITAVAKSAKLKFNSPVKSHETVTPKPLLMQSSPQTLFNTIRRETSLLLSKRDNSLNKATIASEMRLPQRHIQIGNLQSVARQPINRLQHTIKVVVPPTEYRQLPNDDKVGDDEDPENRETAISPSDPPSIAALFSRKPSLSYQVIKRKLELFRESNQVYLGTGTPDWMHSPFASKRRKTTQKSLDRIVDRLQARSTASPSDSEDLMPVSRKPISLQQQLINSSAQLLQTSRQAMTMSAPTPIPVFRSTLTTSGKGTYGSADTSKVVKSKKAKRTHYFGLKFSNYLEREIPQPTVDKISIEQFAKCLNLVRKNDASLQRQQQRLSHAEARWRMPVGNRPLRLRRIRGERIHLPASASYKATRRAGLQ